MNLHKIITLVVCLFGSGLVHAKPPAPPSNLRVKALGVNSFLLEWKDNSTDEAGWEIRVALGANSGPKRFLMFPVPGATSYVVLTNDLSGKALNFQLAAYKGASGAEEISKPTSVVTVTALATATFGKPANLTAKALDDGRIRLIWKDFSTTEQGYQIQYRKGSGKWKDFGNTNPDLTFRLTGSGFLPGTIYSFRVRAFKQTPAIYTKFSNVAKTTTQAFRAPSSLVATAAGDAAISLKWKDRSSIESGYEIESKSGNGAFTKLGDVAANVSSTVPITGFSFNTDHQFRIRAFRVVGALREYTAYSNLALTKTPSLAAPTELAGTAVSNNSVKLTWKHSSAREFGFQIQYRLAGSTDYQIAGTVAANVNEYTVTGLTPGKTYDFQTRAYDFSSYSAFSSVVPVTTRGATLEGDADPPIFWNTSFVHQVGVTNPANLQSLEVTGLPAGLTYEASNRTISGTTTEEGVKLVTLKAAFNDGTNQDATLTLRIVRQQAPPVVAAAFNTVDLSVGGASSVPTSGKFSDPDTADARRIETTLGNFDVILYPSATPVTVANFITYADAGRYNGMFFHRSISDFIVQGGGYRHDGADFLGVTKSPAIQNEPGISNLVGTVAMAKLPGNPNSATSEFFVNVNDNSANLDEQNSGFTVFGRVAGSGLTLLNQINDLPVEKYTVSVDGSSTLLEDVPMNDTAAPAVMDPSKLVKVTAVTAVPILRYEVLSGNEAVATAVVNGTDVNISGVGAGSTTITVKAFDLDGGMVSQTIPVNVTMP
jgi:cyclophilin family peptidyl-prolyl cis-trans isomerase